MNSFLILHGTGDMVSQEESKIDNEEVVLSLSGGEDNGNDEDMENVKERLALAESETDAVRHKNEMLEAQVA